MWGPGQEHWLAQGHSQAVWAFMKEGEMLLALPLRG